MNNKNLQRGLGTLLTISIIAVAFAIAGIAYYAIQKQSREATELQEKVLLEQEARGKKKGEATMEKKEEGSIMKKGGETMMKKENGAMMAKYSGTVLAGKSAPLIAYNKADYDAAVKSDKLVALYFTANWCPICKVEIPNLYAAFNELTTDKVVGFRVDYNDSDTDADEKNLARQLGVVYQHTKVFLKNGKQVLKSPESWSKERNLSEINKAIAQ